MKFANQIKGMALAATTVASVLGVSLSTNLPQQLDTRTVLTAQMTKGVQSAMTPDLALQRLKEGNARFARGEVLTRNLTDERRNTAAGQFPFAVVLSCLDSRTSTELLFDQGIGDVFNARVAGNVLNDDILGSMEFATAVAGAKLIAVIGHTSCGAVKGACDGAKLGNLTGLLDKINPAVSAVKETESLKGDDRVDAVAGENVRLVLRQIRQKSEIIRGLEAEKKLKLVGGMYDLESGVVTFFER
jgi:carbonic anhydrase